MFFDAFNITNSNDSQSADNTVGRRTATMPDGEVVSYARFLRPTGVLLAAHLPRGFEVHVLIGGQGWTSNFKLQTSNFKLRTSNLELPQHAQVRV